MAKIGNRMGAKTPDELVDKVLASTVDNDCIVSTTCTCCGKTFFVLKSELYVESIYADTNKDGQAEEQGESIIYPKCPHCGFVHGIDMTFKPKVKEPEQFKDPFDKEYMPWKDVNSLDWSKYQ